jgi:D-alanyl-D-alanine carboxypeptidase (penicillin-binding protein 5/6)
MSWTSHGKDASVHQTWVVIDADTGRVLMGSNEHVQRPIASLTKIWTALTFIESGAPEGNIKISPEAASEEGSSLFLQQNEIIHTDALLYGLMLRSGNDAAYALAEHGGGSIEGFVDLMNEKALIYNLQNTYFTNPSGLHHETHLSTAYDTAMMMYYAMQNEKFKEIASAHQYISTSNKRTFQWRNKHKLVHSNPAAIAGKTGYTKVAGRTLVTYFEQNDKKIIVVTLNDGDDWKTHTDLANKVFKTYNLVTVAKKGTYRILPGVEGELESPIRLLLTKDERKEVSSIVQIPRGKRELSDGLWTVSLHHEPLITTPVLIKQKK